MNTSRKRRAMLAASNITLQNRLSLGLALFALLASLVVSAGIYLYTRNQVRQDIRQRLLDIASVAAPRIDGDLHATLTDPAQQGSPDYLAIQKELQSIRDGAADLRFVYTMRYDPASGQVSFVVDAETNPEDASLLGDLYPEIDPAVLQSVASLKTPAVDQEPYTDRWGTWLSAYAPVVTSSGKVDGVLGIDMSAEKVLAYERRLLLVAGVLLVVTAIFLAVLGWIIGRQIAAPIVRLTDQAAQIAAIASPETHALSTETPVYAQALERASIDLEGLSAETPEIKRLAQAFNTMTGQLKNLVGSLEERVPSAPASWRSALTTCRQRPS